MTKANEMGSPSIAFTCEFITQSCVRLNWLGPDDDCISIIDVYSDGRVHVDAPVDDECKGDVGSIGKFGYELVCAAARMAKGCLPDEEALFGSFPE